MNAAELIAEGQALEREGDTEGALARYEQATQVAPNSADAWERLGDALMGLRRAEEAIAALGRALELDSTRGNVRRQHAWAFFPLQRYAEGLAACDRGLELDLEDAGLWDARAMMLVGLQRFEDAVSSSDEAIRLAPDAAPFWLNRMSLMRVWNHPAEALEACERALELNPGVSDSLWLIKGDLLNQLGRPEEAEAALTEAMSHEPNEPRNFFQRGVARVNQRNEKKSQEALTDFKRAADMGLRNASVWVFTAQALQQLDRTAEALPYYDQALAEPQNPQTWFIWMQRGLAAASIARYGEAVSNVGQAVQLARDNSDAWFHFGEVLEHAGRFAEVAPAYERALALNPHHPAAQQRRAQIPLQLSAQVSKLDAFLADHPQDMQTWWARADLFCGIGRFDLAVPDLTRALEVAPDDPGAPWNQRGWALNMAGDYPRALMALWKATRMTPNDPNVWGNMAHAYNQVGDRDRARKAAERALKSDPNHLQSLTNMGAALLGLNRPADALTYFDRALSIEPSAVRYSNKAVALLNLNRFDEALEAADKALALEPNEASIQRLKAIITAEMAK